VQGGVDGEWSRGLEMWKHWLGLPSRYYSPYEKPSPGASGARLAPSASIRTAAGVTASINASTIANAGAGAGAFDAGASAGAGAFDGTNVIAGASAIASISAIASVSANVSTADPAAAPTKYTKREISEAVKLLRAAAARRYPNDPSAALELALEVAEEGDVRRMSIDRSIDRV